MLSPNQKNRLWKKRLLIPSLNRRLSRPSRQSSQNLNLSLKLNLSPHLKQLLNPKLSQPQKPHLRNNRRWFSDLQNRKLRESCGMIDLQYLLTVPSPPEPEPQPEPAAEPAAEPAPEPEKEAP